MEISGFLGLEGWGIIEMIYNEWYFFLQVMTFSTFVLIVAQICIHLKLYTKHLLKRAKIKRVTVVGIVTDMEQQEFSLLQ
jgi:hypothetical protein